MRPSFRALVRRSLLPVRRPLALSGRPRILVNVLAGRPPRRSSIGLAAVTRRSAMSRFLTAGPATPFAEIGHHILRFGHSDSRCPIRQSNGERRALPAAHDPAIREYRHRRASLLIAGA